MANAYRPGSGTVFRVRGIPTDWDMGQTESFLAGHYSPASAPSVQSLALEFHRRSKTATFMFLHDVSMPAVTRPNGVWRISLPKSLRGERANQYLILDTDFYGITTLFAPAVDEHKLE
jgi:protein SERAC1